MVLSDLDKEGKLGKLTEEIIAIMAPYYAKKRIAKMTGDRSGLSEAFDKQTEALRQKLPSKLLKEVFHL